MFLGFLIGVLLGGFLSDKFGRRLLVYIPCSMCNVLALLASFVHVYWLYVLLRVLVGVFVGKKDLFQIGSGKGGPDPAFPHSRIPAFPHSRIPAFSLRSAPFFFYENPASRTSHPFHSSLGS